MANPFLMIIDGNSLLASSYHGILPDALKYHRLATGDEESYYKDILQTSDGLYTNAIYGFMKTLLSIIKNQEPQYLVVNWDVGRNTFRKSMYSDYKANRKPTPQPLKEQQETIKKLLTFIGVKQFNSPNYEADDFTGSLAKQFENETYVRILTKDRDHLQLVDDKINVWLQFSINVNNESNKVKELNQKFGVSTNQLNIPNNVFRVTKELVKPYYGVDANVVPDLKGLMGDDADNIPGVSGIGEKTAISLINQFGTIENLYAYISTQTEETILKTFKDAHIRASKKVLDTLKKEENIAKLSKQLAIIKTDINFGDLKLDTFLTNINQDNLKASLQRLEFRNLLKQYF